MLSKQNAKTISTRFLAILASIFWSIQSFAQDGLDIDVDLDLDKQEWHENPMI